MAVTTIREIRNNTSFRVTVRNLEDPADTAQGRGDLAPNEVKVFPPSVELNIPWCGDWEKNDFAKRHIRVQVSGRGTFHIWQAAHDLVDRVRVSMDGRWHKPGDVIGAFAAVGPVEEFILGAKERTLIVNDFSVWLLPFGLSEELKRQAAAQAKTELCAVPLDRPIPSVPKLSAVAFSVAGFASDAFDAGRAGARFLYRDSGKRYAFRLTNGVLEFSPGVKGKTRIDTRVSFRNRRIGESEIAPRFDLIAASGGRLFAKEQGADRFYVALVDEGYVHAGASGGEFAVPSSALVLDPEFNRAGASLAQLTQPLDMEFHDFGAHPATERWPAYRLLLTYGLSDVMLVRVPRLTWMQLDPRPPRGGQSDKLFQQLKTMAKDNAFLLMCAAGILGLADTPMPEAPAPEPEGAPPPAWAPTYRHVSYCAAGKPQFHRESIDYRGCWTSASATYTTTNNTRVSPAARCNRFSSTGTIPTGYSTRPTITASCSAPSAMATATSTARVTSICWCSLRPTRRFKRPPPTYSRGAPLTARCGSTNRATSRNAGISSTPTTTTAR